MENTGTAVELEFHHAINKETSRDPRVGVVRYRIDLERVIIRLLEFMGFERTILMYDERHPVLGVVQKHWLPGYMFVHIDFFQDSWEQINRIPGVLAIMGAPSTIPEDVFNDLIERCPRILPGPDKSAPIPAGTNVEIINGPFAGTLGIVSMSTGKKVWVQLATDWCFNRIELRTKDVMVSR